MLFKKDANTKEKVKCEVIDYRSKLSERQVSDAKKLFYKMLELTKQQGLLLTDICIEEVRQMASRIILENQQQHRF
jgi:hypothetical protein